MTRNEKIEKVHEAFKRLHNEDRFGLAVTAVDAITGPEIGMYGRAEDGKVVWYGELTGITPGCLFPFYVGDIGARFFIPIPGLKEFLEEAEG